jgi:hypothetical protein
VVSARGAALAATLIAGACGKPKINEEKLDAFLREYASKIGEVKGIGCPSLPAELGAAAECTVDFATGPARKIVVTVDDPAVGHVQIRPVVSLVDRDVLRQAVADKFKDDLTLSSLDCPGNQETTVGSAFTCTATFATTPTPTSLPVAVKGAGTTVDWEIARRIIKAELIEADVGKWVAEQNPSAGPVTIDCTADKVLIFAEDGTATCTATAPGVPPATLLLQSDATGVRWKFAP